MMISWFVEGKPRSVGEGLVLGRPLFDLMMFSLCVSLSWVDLTFTRIYMILASYNNPLVVVVVVV